MRVTGYSLEQEAAGEILHIYCEVGVDVGICPLCQRVSTLKKDRQARCVRDRDWGKRRVFVHFDSRRFAGPKGGHRFPEE